MLAWRAQLDGTATKVETGKELQLKANELRRQFIDFVAETSSPNSRFARWSSGVFEKNTAISSLYLYVCYIELLKDYIEKDSGAKSVIVISESWALINAIRDNLTSDGLETIVINSIKETGYNLKNYVLIFLRPLVFIYRCMLQYVFAAVTRKDHPDSEGALARETVIIRTWIAPNFFSKDGIFKDEYFNGLSKWIAANGYNVKLLPIFVSTRISLRKIMPCLRKAENRFLLPWDYLKPADIVKSLWNGFGHLTLKFNRTDFRGLDISMLLGDEKLKFAFSSGGLQCILQHYFFERLSNAGFRIDRIIYTFENMLPEKLFVFALRAFYPDTAIIGFQHSVLYPLYLALYISEKETDTAPLPDKIICSGNFFRSIFLQEKYPEKILETGPALRFSYLHNKKNKPGKPYGGKVMIVLPGYKNEAIYLLTKTLSALKDDDMMIYIKPHPLSDFGDVNRIIEMVKFPKQRIAFETQPLQEIMRQSAVMITISSSVIFDAIASGVPVLRVKKEIDIDLDPADWLRYDPKRDFIAFSTEDIRSEVKRALMLSDNERAFIEDYGKQFLEKTFSPVSDETLAVFIK